jgi:hypothetical protein
VLGGDAPPHFDKWKGFLYLQVFDAQVGKRLSKGFKREYNISDSYMRGVYIVPSAGPRPLIGVINSCRKTAEKS